MFAQRLALMWLLPLAPPGTYFSPGLDVVDALLAALYHTEEPRETIHFVPGPQRGGRVEALRLEARDRDCEARARRISGGASRTSRFDATDRRR